MKSTCTNPVVVHAAGKVGTVKHEVIGDFGYVRGIGVWGHPNLVFSDLTSVEFPTPGKDETQGNFIFIGARHYGFDQDACRHNFEFILKNLFAEK